MRVGTRFGGQSAACVICKRSASIISGTGPYQGCRWLDVGGVDYPATGGRQLTESSAPGGGGVVAGPTRAVIRAVALPVNCGLAYQRWTGLMAGRRAGWWGDGFLRRVCQAESTTRVRGPMAEATSCYALRGRRRPPWRAQGSR